MAFLDAAVGCGHMTVSGERLADLLVDPREDLDCEAKNWLDLQGLNDDKATFAKAVLALANLGGGFIILTCPMDVFALPMK